MNLNVTFNSNKCKVVASLFELSVTLSLLPFYVSKEVTVLENLAKKCRTLKSSY